MSTTWKRLAGDTERFAIQMTLAHDPDQGEGAAPEVSASWGAFQIWIEGQNICAHVEQGELIDSVHWYLLPMLEWLIGNWNALFHEGKVPVQNRLPLSHAAVSAHGILRATRFPWSGLNETDAESWSHSWQQYWQRHALRACREGGLFPDLYVRRWRHLVELSWGNTPLPGVPKDFAFLSPDGLSRLEPQAVAEPLHEILEEVSTQLSRRLPGSQRLMRLAEEVKALKTSSSAMEDRRLAWLAGLGYEEQDIYEGWGRVRREIEEHAPESAAALLGAEAHPLLVPGSCHAALMFGSAAPNLKHDDVVFLARSMARLFNAQPEDVELDRYSRAEPISAASDKTSWQQGYHLAEEISEELGLLREPAVEQVDVRRLLERLGVELDSCSLADESIRAVSIAGPDHRPAVLVNKRHPAHVAEAGVRFTLAHELCHLLFDRGYGMRLALVSGPWAPRDVEKRANAFAAMLLMPDEFVRRAASALSEPLPTLGGIRAVARRLGTSVSATLEHLHNQGFIDEVEYDRVISEWESERAY